MNYGVPTLPINQINLRRVVGMIALLLPKNATYRQLVARFAYLHCILTCDGTALFKSLNVTTSKAIVRSAEPRAFQTTIHNNGSHSVLLYESERLVAIVSRNDSLTLSMPGRGRIWAKSKFGAQPITITTLRICECGIASPIDSYDNPVGAFLL